MAHSQANKDVAQKVHQALAKCIKNEQVYVSNESTAVSPFTYDISDKVAEMLQALIKKVKCTLNAMEDLLAEGELRNVYKKYRADVESILTNDVKKCLSAEGLVGKLK